jgi:hypothetical protein
VKAWPNVNLLMKVTTGAADHNQIDKGLITFAATERMSNPLRPA